MWRNKRNICVTPEACIIAAILLLAVPLTWIIPWFIAAVVHELFHCLALCICDVRIEGIHIDKTGARIHTAPLSNGQTLLCGFAGPTGGLLLLLFAKNFPRLAICALVQTAFNLLPVYPLDGGRVLRSLLCMIFPEKTGHRVFRIITAIVISLLLAMCVAAAYFLHSCLPLLVPVIFYLRMRRK